MHNKLFIVDDSVTIIGGRNIGNEYFEYPGPFVFRSRDLLAFGPVVANSGKYFDEYWNSDWTTPIKDVVSSVPTLAETRETKVHLDQFALDPANYPPGFHDKFKEIEAEMVRLGGELLWGKAKILVDTVPDKDGKPQSRAEIDNTGVTLGRLIGESTGEVLIQSAYLILLDAGFEGIERATARGVNVKLSTNSMAANNHLTAFVGYRKQRKQMLATGAELYEMRPDMKSERALFTQAQLQENKTIFGLHAKTMVFDRKVTFVGSFNLDPRSVNLNTEMGLLVESPTLANAVAVSIENDIAAGNSWQVVTGDAGKVEWITEKNGVITSELETEPMTSAARRVEADALSVIPDNAQL
jgi:phosphatidylserine/phosphatidylglycerophosphate/cardiolipin synthase-like enzyme